MADVAVVDTSAGAAPKAYKVPGAQEILPKSVTATFDCSGAAATVMPALQLIAPSGQVMGTFCDPSVTIAAGGSADVSWFPGLKSVPTAAGGFAALSYAHTNLTATSTACPAGSNTELPAPVSPTQLYINDTATYAYVQNTDFSIYGIQVLTVGHYMICAQFTVNSFGAGAVDLTAAIAEGPALYSSDYGMSEVLASTPIYGDQAGSVTLTYIGFHQVNTHAGNVPADPIVWFINNSGANTAHVTGGTYDIYRIDSSSTFIA